MNTLRFPLNTCEKHVFLAEPTGCSQNRPHPLLLLRRSVSAGRWCRHQPPSTHQKMVQTISPLFLCFPEKTFILFFRSGLPAPFPPDLLLLRPLLRHPRVPPRRGARGQEEAHRGVPQGAGGAGHTHTAGDKNSFQKKKENRSIASRNVAWPGTFRNLCFLSLFRT